MKRKRRNLIIESVTIISLLGTAIHATLGFFVYRFWEWLWKKWKKEDEV